MKRVVYIIPGYGGSEKHKVLKKIESWFEKKGITPKFVKIRWTYRTHDDYLNDFFNHHTPNEEVYLFGFSFGAMTAFMASTQIKVKTLFLCSLSPYFKEDLDYIPASYKMFIGKKRMSVLNKLSFNELAKKVRADKTIIIVGVKEGGDSMRRAQEAHKQIKNSELVVINARHKLESKVYLDAVEKVIRTLN